MIIVKGFSKVSKKGYSAKKRSYYAPMVITYADGTRKYIGIDKLKADGSLKKGAMEA